MQWLKAFAIKGSITGEQLFNVSLLIPSGPLLFLFFNLAITLDTSFSFVWFNDFSNLSNSYLCWARGIAEACFGPIVFEKFVDFSQFRNGYIWYAFSSLLWPLAFFVKVVTMFLCFLYLFLFFSVGVFIQFWNNWFLLVISFLNLLLIQSFD